MIRIITLIGTLFLILASCTEQKKQSNLTKKNEVKTVVDEDASNAAKRWLIKNIDSYFSTVELDSLDILMQQMTTSTYYDYKTDAISVDLDGSLTQTEFDTKWKSKFDTDKAGVGSGFLISGQDWSKIIVEKCELITKDENGFWFDIVLEDKDFGAKYPIKIRIVSSVDGYKVADVVE